MTTSFKISNKNNLLNKIKTVHRTCYPNSSSPCIVVEVLFVVVPMFKFDELMLMFDVVDELPILIVEVAFVASYPIFIADALLISVEVVESIITLTPSIVTSFVVDVFPMSMSGEIKVKDVALFMFVVLPLILVMVDDAL